MKRRGVSCDIVEYGRQLLADPEYPEKLLTALMGRYGIEVLTAAAVTSIEPGRVLVRRQDEVMSRAADTVITAVGYRSENKLYEAVRDLNRPVYNIGDSNQVRNIMYAVWNAYEITRNI